MADLTTQTVQLEGDGMKLPAYLAAPQGGGKLPAIVVIQEAFGVNDHIKGVTRRIAAEGYVAIAPELYYRNGPGSVAPYTSVDAAVKLMSTLIDHQMMEDVRSTFTYLKGHPNVRADRMGIIGWCMGGRLAFLSACLDRDVKATVCYYGGGIVSDKPTPQRPMQPLSYAEHMRCPILCHFGDGDAGIPVAHVQQIEQRLKELGKQAEVHLYTGGIPHGFNCDQRDSYREGPAKEAWQRTTAFFQRHLKG